MYEAQRLAAYAAAKKLRDEADAAPTSGGQSPPPPPPPPPSAPPAPSDPHEPDPATPAQEGERLKREGMKRVDEHANEEWKRDSDIAAARAILKHEMITADEVWFELEDLVGETHENRAMGPVMLRFARRGMIEKAPIPPRKSVRKSRHSGPMQVWQRAENWEGARRLA